MRVAISLAEYTRIASSNTNDVDHACVSCIRMRELDAFDHQCGLQYLVSMTHDYNTRNSKSPGQWMMLFDVMHPQRFAMAVLKYSLMHDAAGDIH